MVDSEDPHRRPYLTGIAMVKPNMTEQFETYLSEEPLAQLSDEHLVTAHLEGRMGAFEDLYERYHDRLVHFVTRKTGDSDRAQDLVRCQGPSVYRGAGKTIFPIITKSRTT